MTSPLISLCLILRDNSDPGRIRSFLEDMKRHVDELVVVISCSDSIAARTAGEYTDRVFVEPGLTSHDMALQFAVEQARCPWVLALNVSERLHADLKTGLRQLIRSGHDGYWIAVLDVNPDGTISPDPPRHELRFFRKMQEAWPEIAQTPQSRPEKTAKVEGAYILKRPCDGCQSTRPIPPGCSVALLEERLHSGRGEEVYDLGYFLEGLEKTPAMDTEEALIRFLHELSRG